MDNELNRINQLNLMGLKFVHENGLLYPELTQLIYKNDTVKTKNRTYARVNYWKKNGWIVINNESDGWTLSPEMLKRIEEQEVENKKPLTGMSGVKVTVVQSIKDDVVRMLRERATGTGRNFERARAFYELAYELENKNAE